VKQVGRVTASRAKIRNTLTARPLVWRSATGFSLRSAAEGRSNRRALTDFTGRRSSLGKDGGKESRVSVVLGSSDRHIKITKPPTRDLAPVVRQGKKTPFGEIPNGERGGGDGLIRRGEGGQRIRGGGGTREGEKETGVRDKGRM